MPDAESEQEEDISSEEEEEEEQKQPTQAYLSLMKSLAESSPNKAKRRKLDHSSSTEVVLKTTETETEIDTRAEESDASEPRETQEDPDLVDEAEGEEDPADTAIEDLFDEDDDLDAEDPFEVHFDSPKDELVQPRIKTIQEGGWKTKRAIENSMRIQLSTPNDEQSLPGPVTGIADLKLKKRLKESMATKRENFDTVEQTIAPLLFSYQDLLYCDRTVIGGESVRRMACLHALNHIFKYVNNSMSRTNSLLTNNHLEPVTG